MKSNSRPTRWATLTLVLGLASAYPFLRNPSDSTSPGAPIDDEGDLTAEHFDEIPAVAFDPQAPVKSFFDSESSLHASVISQRSELPSTSVKSLPSTSILAPALPEWAKPATALDELVSNGVDSEAGSIEAQELRRLPTWVDNASPTVEGTHRLTSQSRAVALDDRGSSGEDGSFRSSPFSREENFVGNPSGRRPPLAWPDREQVGNLVSTLAKEAGPTTQASPPISKKADRKKRFVYQPGHQPHNP